MRYRRGTKGGGGTQKSRASKRFSVASSASEQSVVYNNVVSARKAYISGLGVRGNFLNEKIGLGLSSCLLLFLMRIDFPSTLVVSLSHCWTPVEPQSSPVVASPRQFEKPHTRWGTAHCSTLLQHELSSIHNGKLTTLSNNSIRTLLQQRALLHCTFLGGWESEERYIVYKRAINSFAIFYFFSGLIMVAVVKMRMTIFHFSTLGEGGMLFIVKGAREVVVLLLRLLLFSSSDPPSSSPT